MSRPTGTPSERGRESPGDGVERHDGRHASDGSLTHSDGLERLKRWAALAYVLAVLGWVAVDVAAAAGGFP